MQPYESLAAVTSAPPDRQGIRRYPPGYSVEGTADTIPTADRCVYIVVPNLCSLLLEKAPLSWMSRRADSPWLYLPKRVFH